MTLFENGFDQFLPYQFFHQSRDVSFPKAHRNSCSPQMGGGQPGMYQQDRMSGSSTGGMTGYDSSNYSGEFLEMKHHGTDERTGRAKTDQTHFQTASTVQSPTHMGYSNFQPSSLQTNQQRGHGSRLRAASASLPLGLDLRTQFRSVGGSGSLQPSAHSPGGSGRTASTSQLSSGVSSSYSGSFPSAPLTAPHDFSLPRTSGFRSSGNDYSMPQMSATRVRHALEGLGEIVSVEPESQPRP